MTTKFKLRWGNIEVEFEGSEEYIERKFNEIMEKIEASKSAAMSSAAVMDVSESPDIESMPLQEKSLLSGIIEYRANRPHLAIPSAHSKLSLSEVMALFLYVYEPALLTIGDLRKIIIKNWKDTRTEALGATLATALKGRVIREGSRGKYVYTLSGSGRDMVENKIIPKLKSS